MSKVLNENELQDISASGTTLATMEATYTRTVLIQEPMLRLMFSS